MRFKNLRRRNQLGMTLIEVMITMGIASGLVLAVMEAVTMVTKQAKSVAVSSDWTALIGNVRSAINNPSQCTCLMTANAVSVCGAAVCGATSTVYKSFANIDTYSAACVATTAPLLVGPSGVNGGTIYITKLDLLNTANQPTQQIPYVIAGAPSQAYIDHVELDIRAKKIMGGIAGTSGLQGGQQTLFATNQISGRIANGINFEVVRNMASGVVLACYGIADQAQQACLDLGGVYNTTTYPTTPNTPLCQLENLQFSRGNSTSAPTSITGQKLQLKRASGNFMPQSVSDYSIGVDSSSMWFSAGANGATGVGFGWYNQAGATPLMTLNGPVTGNAAAFAFTGMTVNVDEYHGMGANQTVLFNGTGSVQLYPTGSNYFYASAGNYFWYTTTIFSSGTQNFAGAVTNHYNVFGVGSDNHTATYELHTGANYDLHTGAGYELHTGGTERHNTYEVHQGYESHSGENDFFSTEYHYSYEQHNGYEDHYGTEHHVGYEQHTGYEIHVGYEDHYGSEHHVGYEQHTGYELHAGQEYHGGYEVHSGYEIHGTTESHNGYEVHNGYELHSAGEVHSGAVTMSRTGGNVAFGCYIGPVPSAWCAQSTAGCSVLANCNGSSYATGCGNFSSVWDSFINDFTPGASSCRTEMYNYNRGFTMEAKVMCCYH